MARAVFVDRDGVLNDLVYHREEGRVLSPFSAAELRVFPSVPEAVRRLRQDLGFEVVVISNQPGVAKQQFTLAELEKMNEKIRRALAKADTSFDSEYYCLHHPSATIAKYRVDCDCRKPKPGLLLQASRENGIDLESSYFVGDSLIDVKAGRRAGCKTILVGHLTSMLAQLIEREDARPDYLLGSLKDVPDLLAKIESRSRRALVER